MTNHYEYSFPSIAKFINWLINKLFFNRLLFVLVAVLLAIFSSYEVWIVSEEKERLKNVVSIMTCGSIIIGIFYTVLNYEYNKLKHTNDVKSSRDSLSFNVSFEWHKPNIVENLKITKQLYDEHKSLIDNNHSSDFSAILEKDEKVRAALVSILNYFECIAIGCEQGIMDKIFIEKVFKSVMLYYSKNYGFYISHKRNVQNDNTIWIGFTNLVETWNN